MRKHLQWFSCVVIYLIAYLIFSPVVFAAKPGVPIAEKPTQLQQKVAVVELNDGRLKPNIVEKVADTLRDELSHKAAFTVLSKAATYSFFESSPNLLSRVDSANPLNRYLDQVKEHYRMSEFPEAVSILQSTIDTYRESKTSLTDAFLLTDAYLMLGNVYMGMHDTKKAAGAFREALRLDPSREITERYYPPKTVKAFQETKLEVIKTFKKAALDIESVPKKADVYINGNLKGQTPLTLSDFSLGEHFILIKKDDYQSQARRFKLDEKGFREKFILEKKLIPDLSPNGLSVSDFNNVSEQVRMASVVGSGMGVDKIILVSVEEVGWHHKISARMIDMKYQASHKVQSVEVVDLAKDSKSAASHIVGAISEAATIDLAKNPKKYADSDVIVIGSKKKKSRKMKVMLWSLLGVAVAGGAAGAFLIGGGGKGASNASSVSVQGAIAQSP